MSKDFRGASGINLGRNCKELQGTEIRSEFSDKES